MGFDLADYVTELKVPEGSPVIGKQVRELDDLAAKSDVEILGLTRTGKRLPGLARRVEIKAGDMLVVEAHPESITEALGTMGLDAGLEEVFSQSFDVVGQTAHVRVDGTDLVRRLLQRSLDPIERIVR